MAAAYELWDRETANQIGSNASRAEAMAVVRDAVREFGVAALATVALGCEDDDGDTVVIAAGRELAAIALHEDPLPTSPSTSP